MSTLNKQVGGNHYKLMSIQPWEIIDALNLNFYEGCVLKYLLRKKTDRVGDLRKAVHCLEHMIENAERAAQGEEAEAVALPQPSELRTPPLPPTWYKGTWKCKL